jgi:hypothetical protein
LQWFKLAFRKVLFEKAGGYMLISDRLARRLALYAGHAEAHQYQSCIRCRSRRLGGNAGGRQHSGFSAAEGALGQRSQLHAHLNRLFFGVILATFLANLTPIVYLIMWIAGAGSFAPFFWAVLLKTARRRDGFQQSHPNLSQTGFENVFPLWFILQPFYIVTMGILSFFGNRLGWGKRVQSEKVIGD